MATLICTVGLPKSGKTTWAKAEGHPIVSPDAIRIALHGERFIPVAEQMVWAIADIMVRALFCADHDFVILDACNNTRKRRDRWLGSWNTAFHAFATPKDVCMARARTQGDLEIIPVIERMAEEHQPVTEGEGRAVEERFKE